MCNITDNFMEDALFYQKMKQEYEHRMWWEWMKEKEAEEEAYLSQAEQYFKDLKEFEITQMEKEYRSLNEWEELDTV